MVPHIYREEVLADTVKKIGWKTLHDIVKGSDIGREISHRIVRIDPDRHRWPLVSIATRHISDLIFEHLLQSDGRRVATLLSICIREGPTGLSLTGWLLDKALHKLLTGIRQWEVRELERDCA